MKKVSKGARNHSKTIVSHFNRILFRWYRKYGRHSLPWRHTRDPYRILVSEVMLQQTQVERVLPKYREFLRRFPTIASLARASLGDVLRAWSGLGYNRRARYLHDCARAIIARGGTWPRTFSGLLELPGVGPSTAAAISSFAFHADEPMIDTNIRRVVCRVFFGNVRDSKLEVRRKTPSDQVIYTFAKTLIPKNRGKEWNWAMMDVGALLCKAKNHNPKCPFQELHGPVGNFIYKKPQKKFAGSARFYRGRILAALSATPKGVRVPALLNTLRISETRFNQLIKALRKESLIAVKNGVLALP